MKSITSVANPRLKRAVRLRSRRGRVQQQRFLIDGFREISRAVDAGSQLGELFICPELLAPAQLAAIEDWQRRIPLEAFCMPLDLWRRVAYGDRTDGVVASALVARIDMEAIPIAPPALLVVVESLEKPGNLGAIARSANAAGFHGLICTGQGTDVFHPNAIRASTGAVFDLPVCHASTEEAMSWLSSESIQMVAARPDGDRAYTEIDYRLPSAIVLGNESQGLSERWRGPRISTVRIPMQGTVDSLNVSVTAALLLFEARRQRTQQSGGGESHR